MVERKSHTPSSPAFHCGLRPGRDGNSPSRWEQGGGSGNILFWSSKTTALPHLHLCTLNEGLSFVQAYFSKGCCRKKVMVYVPPFISSHMFQLVPALELLRPHDQLVEEVDLAAN